jgi:CubicO group peptidase (beta-lactamase class C family)
MEQPLNIELKLITMKLRKLLFTILICNIAIVSFAQTNKTLYSTTIQKNIKKVENSLTPLVLNKAESLWNLEKQMQKYNVSGLSIAVIHNYEIEWAKGYGSTGGKEIPNVTEQTVFQTASMSKFVNAVAMMKLMESKKIRLNEDINNFLTSWKFPYNKNIDTNPITIRQLLSHTAGLSTHGFNGYKNSNNLPTIIQILEGSKPANSDKVEQIQPQNKEFKYSGGGVTISQLILMENSNLSYESFLNTNIFEPLKMSKSFYSTEFDKYPKDLAFGQKGNGRNLKNNYNLYPESAAAGLWTTPTNLSKLIIDIQLSLKDGTGKILSQQATKELIEPTLKNSNSGLGVFSEYQNGQLYLQHSGANKGFRGKFYFSAENGNGVVIMVNGTNTEIIEEIIRSITSVYNWAGFEKLVASSELDLNDTDLNKYTGAYTLENREVNVSLKKGKLILTEKGKWSSKLTALNNSTFVVDIVKPQATIEFVTDTDGSISKCILKQGELTEWIKRE